MAIKPIHTAISDPGPIRGRVDIGNSSPSNGIPDVLAVLAGGAPYNRRIQSTRNSTHSGNTRIWKNIYNRKMGFLPDRNPVFFLPIPPMLKKTTTATLSLCHPIPVVRGGGFAGRAGWFRSRAAVPLVSF